MSSHSFERCPRHLSWVEVVGCIIVTLPPAILVGLWYVGPLMEILK